MYSSVFNNNQQNNIWNSNQNQPLPGPMQQQQNQQPFQQGTPIGGNTMMNNSYYNNNNNIFSNNNGYGQQQQQQQGGFNPFANNNNNNMQRPMNNMNTNNTNIWNNNTNYSNNNYSQNANASAQNIFGNNTNNNIFNNNSNNNQYQTNNYNNPSNNNSIFNNNNGQINNNMQQSSIMWPNNNNNNNGNIFSQQNNNNNSIFSNNGINNQNNQNGILNNNNNGILNMTFGMNNQNNNGQQQFRNPIIQNRMNKPNGTTNTSTNSIFAQNNSTNNTSSIFSNNFTTNNTANINNNQNSIFNNNNNINRINPLQANSNIFMNQQQSNINNNNNIFRTGTTTGLTLNNTSNQFMQQQQFLPALLNRPYNNNANNTLFSSKLLLPPPKRFQIKKSSANSIIDPEGWVGGYLQFKGDGKVIKLDKDKAQVIEDCLQISKDHQNQQQQLLSSTTKDYRKRTNSLEDFSLGRIGMSLQLARKTPSILMNSESKPQYFARDDQFRANQRDNHYLGTAEKQLRDNSMNGQDRYSDGEAIPRGAEELLYRQNQFYSDKPERPLAVYENPRDIQVTSQFGEFMQMSQYGQKFQPLVRAGSLNGFSKGILKNSSSRFTGNQYYSSQDLFNSASSSRGIHDYRPQQYPSSPRDAHDLRSSGLLSNHDADNNPMFQRDLSAETVVFQRDNQTKKHRFIHEMENDPKSELYLPRRMQNLLVSAQSNSSASRNPNNFSDDSITQEDNHRQIKEFQSNDGHDNNNNDNSSDVSNNSDVIDEKNPFKLKSTLELGCMLKNVKNDEQNKKSTGFFSRFMKRKQDQGQNNLTQQQQQDQIKLQQERLIKEKQLRSDEGSAKVLCHITNISQQQSESEDLGIVAVQQTENLHEFLARLFQVVCRKTGLIWHGDFNHVIGTTATYQQINGEPLALSHLERLMSDYEFPLDGQLIIEYFVSESPIQKQDTKYITQPSVQEMSQWSLGQLQSVENFIIQNEQGRIEFKEPVDLTRQNLDEIVIIESKQAIVYPENIFSGGKCPRKGAKLNHPAIVTLYCIDQNAYQQHLAGQLNYDEIEMKLIQMTQSMGCQFVDFNRNNFHFSFKVNDWTC